MKSVRHLWQISQSSVKYVARNKFNWEIIRQIWYNLAAPKQVISQKLKKMAKEQKETELNIPNHVAIIPDGNRRWARSRKLPTLVGHSKGFDKANEVIRKGRDLGVHTMTLWAFSTENWNRSQEEVDYLMKLYEEKVDKHLEEAKKEDVRIYHLGRKDRIPESLRNKIIQAEEETKDKTKHVLNIALDYGGHDELLRAMGRAYKDIEEGNKSVEDLSNVVGKYNGKYPYYEFKNYLDTMEQPYPYVDLLIRTSGEQRVSGFLSWQLAYCEYYFAKVHMPAFGEKEFVEALKDFSNRERRFGGDSKKQ